MPDPRRTLIALLSACAFLVVSPVMASATAGAGEYTETAPGPEGPVPTNDIVGGNGGSGNDSGSGTATPGDAGSSEAVVATPITTPTKADEKLAGKGSAGKGLLGLIGTTDRSPDLGVGFGGSADDDRTVGARLLDGAGGSAGGMGFLLYLLVGATALWAVATAVGRNRQAATL